MSTGFWDYLMRPAGQDVPHGPYPELGNDAWDRPLADPLSPLRMLLDAQMQTQGLGLPRGGPMQFVPGVALDPSQVEDIRDPARNIAQWRRNTLYDPSQQQAQELGYVNSLPYRDYPMWQGIVPPWQMNPDPGSLVGSPPWEPTQRRQNPAWQR